MNSPGAKSLFIGGSDFQITAADTYVGDWTTGLAGIISASFLLSLAYGSGGTSGKAFVQTSLDAGNTALDIYCMTFTTASKVVVFNLSALTPKTTAITPGDGALADDTALDGILGDRFRLKLVTVGVYAAQTILAGRFIAR